MPNFLRAIGVDYSGAQTPKSSLSGLRVFCAEGAGEPCEILPPPSPRKYFTRIEVAQWLLERLREDVPTVVGVDHSFSFPTEYFKAYQLAGDWPSFLDDFCWHWPTDEENTYVDFIRDGHYGLGAARAGNSRWRKLAERRCGAKSSFQFDIPGSAAKSTHAGLPWLRYLRQRLVGRVHFWPFDGWTPPPGRSVIAEVYPRLCAFGAAPRVSPRISATPTTLRPGFRGRIARAGSPIGSRPTLTTEERARADIEGWILGVP